MNKNDLTSGSIISHIRRIAIPSSIGFMFNTLINIIDTYYAGKISPEALSGLAISFPVFFLIIALSSGIGSGTTALISISLGRKDTSAFHKLAFNALSLGIILSVIILTVSPFVAPLLYKIMGAKGESLQYGLDYIHVILFGSVFFVLNFIINGILTSQGDTRSFRNIIIFACILNAILDPIFVYGWFGIPQLGTSGIALATIISECIATFYLSYKLLKSPLFDLETFKKCKIELNVFKEILSQGIPASLNMLTIAIGSFIINTFVQKYGGDSAMAAYGVGLRIEQLALLLTVGLNIATLTIAGQNFGAGNFNRIKELYKTSLSIAITIMTIGIIIIYPFANNLVSLFNSSPEIIREGANYLRIEVFAFYTYVILFISNSILQGIKKPKFSFYISFYRQILIPIPLFYVLVEIFNLGINGVWWGIVISNWSAVIISVNYTLKSLKNIENSNSNEKFAA